MIETFNHEELKIYGMSDDEFVDFMNNYLSFLSGPGACIASDVRDDGGSWCSDKCGPMKPFANWKGNDIHIVTTDFRGDGLKYGPIYNKEELSELDPDWEYKEYVQDIHTAKFLFLWCCYWQLGYPLDHGLISAHLINEFAFRSDDIDRIFEHMTFKSTGVCNHLNALGDWRFGYRDNYDYMRHLRETGDGYDEQLKWLNSLPSVEGD